MAQCAVAVEVADLADEVRALALSDARLETAVLQYTVSLLARLHRPGSETSPLPTLLVLSGSRTAMLLLVRLVLAPTPEPFSAGVSIQRQ